MDKRKANEFFCSPAICSSFCFLWVMCVDPVNNTMFPFLDLRLLAGSRQSVHIAVNSVRSLGQLLSRKSTWHCPTQEAAAFTPMWPTVGTRQFRSQLVNANISGEIWINSISLSPVDWKCHKNTVKLSGWSLKMSTNERNNGLLIHLSQVWHPYDIIYDCIDVFQFLVSEIFDKENNHETSEFFIRIEQ